MRHIFTSVRITIPIYNSIAFMTINILHYTEAQRTLVVPERLDNKYRKMRFTTIENWKKFKEKDKDYDIGDAIYQFFENMLSNGNKEDDDNEIAEFNIILYSFQYFPSTEVYPEYAVIQWVWSY
jgi:hypothetical protein